MNPSSDGVSDFVCDSVANPVGGAAPELLLWQNTHDIVSKKYIKKINISDRMIINNFLIYVLKFILLFILFQFFIKYFLNLYFKIYLIIYSLPIFNYKFLYLITILL